MRTNDLIGLLAQDTARPKGGWRHPAMLLAGGAAASFLLFVAVLDARVDLLAAEGARATLGKWLPASLLVLLAGAAALRLRHPEVDASFTSLAAALGVVAALAITADLFVNGAGDLGRRALGSSAAACLASIGFLSLPVLGAFLLLLRQGAVTHPERAGLASGLAAAGLAAAIYALHCNEDSPLFVASWYGLAVVLVGGAGSLIGRVALRW